MTRSCGVVGNATGECKRKVAGLPWRRARHRRIKIHATRRHEADQNFDGEEEIEASAGIESKSVGLVLLRFCRCVICALRWWYRIPPRWRGGDRGVSGKSVEAA